MVDLERKKTKFSGLLISFQGILFWLVYHIGLYIAQLHIWGFPDDVSGKEPTCQCRSQRDSDLISGSGRSPGEGNGNPLQNSCLKISMNRGTCWATVHRVTRSRKELDMTEHGYTFTFNPLKIHPCCI